MPKLPFLLAIVPTAAFASQGADHGDPVAAVVLALTIILVAAKLGGELAVRVGQSAVLGELLVPLARKLASGYLWVQCEGHDQSGALVIQTTPRSPGNAAATHA